MKSKFRIDIPCSVKWENMENWGEHRFCGSCKKNVFDIKKLSLNELTSSNVICGKITHIKPLFSSVFLAFTLATTSCTIVPSKSTTNVEELYQKEITINGKIISKENRKIIESEISFITLEKIYHTKADENGDFTLKFPEKFLVEQNVVRIDFTLIDYNKENFTDFTASIISKKELMGLKDFPIEEKYTTIGAVVISDNEPPDLYYFNGKKISKRKFNRLKLENPDFKTFVFYNEMMIQKLSKKNYVDNLYLLYSN